MSTVEDRASFHYFRVHYRESVERMFAVVSDLYAEYLERPLSFCAIPGRQ